MARLVKRFRTEPYAINLGGETVSICGCGLSATQPYCDGTHTLTASEEGAKLYWYDESGKRTLAADSHSGMRSDKQTLEA